MKIQTYTPTNVKFEYGGDDFRVEIYIKERTDKDKIKAATKKGEIYKPEKKRGCIQNKGDRFRNKASVIAKQNNKSKRGNF